MNGKLLNEILSIKAKHALYREDGTWYHHLKHFPGVLFDRNGYLFLSSKSEYENHPDLQHTQDLHISKGISSIAGYITFSDEDRKKISFSIKIKLAKRTEGIIRHENIYDLRTAQVQFEGTMNTVLAARRELYNIRDSFAQYYTTAQIRRMPLEHYALGNDLPKTGYHFCHTLERRLDGLGRTTGATAFKFGVYYGVTRSDKTPKYRYTKKFGDDYLTAFDNIKSNIIELIEAGKNKDINAIVDNPISPMFKGKILSTFFPDRYLNIFSDEHLEYFLVQLNLDTEDLIWSDAVVKREALVAFKNEDEVMRNWPLDLFSYFLYRVYPGALPRGGKTSSKNDPLSDYRNPVFPLAPNTDWIDLTILPPQTSTQLQLKKTSRNNPDYEKQARKFKKYGDRGEKIVLDMEKKRLKELGREDLSKRIRKAEFDYLGYDLKSFEENGELRYIEVKATSSKVGIANFFLSANELNKAQELSNYFVYIVYDILSYTPKIWVLKNPFKPENPNVKKIPITYRVTINAK